MLAITTNHRLSVMRKVRKVKVWSLPFLVGPANEDEQHTEDCDGCHYYQRDSKQSVTALCGACERALGGVPTGAVGDCRSGGFDLIEDSAKYAVNMPELVCVSSFFLTTPIPITTAMTIKPITAPILAVSQFFIPLSRAFSRIFLRKSIIFNYTST